MRTNNIMGLKTILFAVMFFFITVTIAGAQPPGPKKVLPPPKKVTYNIKLEGVNATMVTWWFNHIADKGGTYWKPLSKKNKSIKWAVSLQQAKGLIGSVYTSEQEVAGEPFKMRIQYADWSTQPRGRELFPLLPVPADYKPRYPSPKGRRLGPGEVNGFNMHMLILDDAGFVPGRILWSFADTGGDDTKGKIGNYSVDMSVTFYLTWMEGYNRPPGMTKDGYYYSDKQIKDIWANFKEGLTALPRHLVAWWDEDSQDGAARENGWTIISVLDNGVLPGVTSEMITWHWNHLGDAPGTNYIMWAPTAHKTIAWIPGCSPAEILGTDKLPKDKVVVGAISPDIQGNRNLVRGDMGAMWLDNSNSPVPGYYKYLNNLTVARCGVENPPPVFQLHHTWQDVPGGAVWRTSMMMKLPLRSPNTQAAFQFEHSWYEGSTSAGYLPQLYNKWVRENER